MPFLGTYTRVVQKVVNLTKKEAEEFVVIIHYHFLKKLEKPIKISVSVFVQVKSIQT